MKTRNLKKKLQSFPHLTVTFTLSSTRTHIFNKAFVCNDAEQFPETSSNHFWQYVDKDIIAQLIRRNEVNTGPPRFLMIKKVIRIKSVLDVVSREITRRLKLHSKKGKEILCYFKYVFTASILAAKIALTSLKGAWISSVSHLLSSLADALFPLRDFDILTGV